MTSKFVKVTLNVRFVLLVIRETHL